MPKTHTRASSKGKFQYQELSFSNIRRKARVSLSPIRSATVTHTPVRSISTPHVVRSQPRIPSTYINKSLAYMARAHDFATFNGGSPLLLAQRHDMLVLSLKSIPEFIGETSISLSSIFKRCLTSIIFIASPTMM